MYNIDVYLRILDPYYYQMCLRVFLLLLLLFLICLDFHVFPLHNIRRGLLVLGVTMVVGGGGRLYSRSYRRICA